MTRAIFDSLDVDNNNSLTASEIDRGLRELLKDNQDVDCVTVGVAKKVAREMSSNESISLVDFEARALAAASGLTDPNSKDAPSLVDEESTFLHEQFP